MVKRAIRMQIYSIIQIFPTFVKNELNLFPILILFDIMLLLSLKKHGKYFLSFVLIKISLMVFQIALKSFSNLVNIFS